MSNRTKTHEDPVLVVIQKSIKVPSFKENNSTLRLNGTISAES